ncbi:hypothetical protein PoB_000778800 [Plakobranchus ocellatus]|uniref:Uncharacterized protein n=1 Tax=Plakobranchus ocellatus TaxID=259542 RepID=A0AAV3YFU1_9GAST|nr:hypothetical protein PoB_000778800 [Plakobranchus ocellatus]
MAIQEYKQRTSKGVTQSLSSAEYKEPEDNTCISDPKCLSRPTSSPTPPTAAPSCSAEVKSLLYKDACLPETSTGTRGAPRARSSSHTEDQMKKSAHAGKGGKGKGKESEDSIRDNKDVGEALASIQEQVKALMALVPMVHEMKNAYGGYIEATNDEHLMEDAHIQINSGEEDNGEDFNKANASSSYFEDVAGTSAPRELHLQSHIAKGIEKLLSEGLGKNSRDELSKKYHTPTNCPRLNTLQCNPEIFKHANVRARIRDNALQNVQKALTKGLTAITLILDQLKEDKDSDILEKVADGVALILDASHSLDLFRRQAFKGELKEEYNSLCSGVYPATDSLFGPDINENIKSVNESMRVAKTTRKFQSYNKNTRRFPFLGQRPHWKSRGEGSNTGHQPQRNHWQSHKRQFPKKKM